VSLTSHHITSEPGIDGGCLRSLSQTIRNDTSNAEKERKKFPGPDTDYDQAQRNLRPETDISGAEEAREKDSKMRKGTSEKPISYIVNLLNPLVRVF
jgi:hypothetical protein